jgi:hypothetical protein
MNELGIGEAGDFGNAKVSIDVNGREKGDSSGVANGLILIVGVLDEKLGVQSEYTLDVFGPGEHGDDAGKHC